MPKGDEDPQSKGTSAAVRRRLMKSRMSGRSGKIHEDVPGFNPQTMGDKKYKVGSPAYKLLDEMGEARVQETPHRGRGKHALGEKIPKAAIRRRSTNLVNAATKDYNERMDYRTKVTKKKFANKGRSW